MNKKQKGFTIVELIVVIAIIAVLAGIVLVNVTQYIAKAKDTAIKADISAAVTAAAGKYADPNTGLTGFIASTDYTTPSAAITASGGGSVTGTCDNMTDGDCISTATKFCMSATLATSSSTIYCKDITGKVGAATCAAGVCP